MVELPAFVHLLWIAGFVVLLLGLYMLRNGLRTRARPDAVKALYDRFCRKLAQLGATRGPAEGPRDFGRRAASLFPQHAVRIQNIAEQYITLRYAKQPSPDAIKSFANDVRAFATRGSRE